MISCRNLSKKYGHVRAVDDLTFQVQSGRVTGFLGPNGAGKSTTMRMVMGLDRPSGGAALINGTEYRHLNEPLRHVGALLDAEAMHPGRSGLNHLRIGARSNGLPASRIDAVIEQVGLGDAAKRRIKTYSLGMRQRLGIASALLGDPPVMIFDEPVNGLDIDGVRWIRSLLRRLADEGRTVFVSSHMMSELQLIADHIIIIGRGKLIADTTLQQLLGSLSGKRLQVSTSSPDALTALLQSRDTTVTRTGPREIQVRGRSAQDIHVKATAAGIPVTRVVEIAESLEEAYLRLTGEPVEFQGATSVSSEGVSP